MIRTHTHPPSCTSHSKQCIKMSHFFSPYGQQCSYGTRTDGVYVRSAFAESMRVASGLEPGSGQIDVPWFTRQNHFAYRSDRLDGVGKHTFSNWNVLAPPFARPPSDVCCVGLFTFIFFWLLPSRLGSTAPPQRAVGWENHDGGLGGHTVRSGGGRGGRTGSL